MMPWLIWRDLAYDLEYLQIPIKISSSGSIESNDWKSGVMLSDSSFGQKFQQLWKFLLHWRWILTSLAVIKSVLMMRDSLTLWFVLWLVTQDSWQSFVTQGESNRACAGTQCLWTGSRCSVAFRITSERKKEREIERQRVTDRKRDREPGAVKENLLAQWFGFVCGC